MWRKFTRREAVKAAVAAAVAAPLATDARVVEPESDIRPALPFSEDQALALLRPIASPTVER